MNPGSTRLTDITGPWHDSPEKAVPFTFNTPTTIPHTNKAFSTNNAPRFNFGGPRDTPGTDATGDATDDGGPSEQDSPAAIAHRATMRHKISNIAKLKIRRRRQRHNRDMYQDVDSDDEETTMSKRQEGSNPDATAWSLNHHRDLPYIASGYLQLFFNISLLSILLYFLVSFIMTIQADVNKKVEEYSAEILSEISICSKEYLENRCSPDQRVPAMQMACQAWERCMERDPAQVGRARVSAETFAEIVNSLIEPISYKTMIFCLVLVFGSLFVSNFAFGILRSKQHSGQNSSMASQQAQPATFMIQATPQVARRQQKQVEW